VALRVLCAEYAYLCGYLAEGGEDGVLVRRVSRLAARYTARVAETATEWAVKHAVAAGGPGGGDAAVEALAGLVAREGGD
jgi:hypothetical protein